MANLALAARFILEIVGIVAASYWGYQASDQAPLRWVLAIGAPVALVVVWALVIAPGADNPIPATTRMLLGSGLLLLTAVGLSAVGQPAWALIFAAAIVIDTVAILAVGD